MHIDLIYVMHQLKRLLFADIFVKRTAEVVGNIVFTVGKGSRAAKAAHNGTALAADAGLYLFSVNRAMPLIQSVSCFKDRHLET
jgi:hypothetical protein